MSGMFEVRHDGDGFRVSGELDVLTTSTLYLGLTSGPEGEGPIRVDMSRVTFIDSHGLRVLLRLGERRGVTIVNPSSQVRRLLEITGTKETFGVE